MPHTIQRGGGIRRNNTTISHNPDGSHSVTLHATRIVHVHVHKLNPDIPRWTVTYDTGGWKTPTTARRMIEVATAWGLPQPPGLASWRTMRNTAITIYCPGRTMPEKPIIPSWA